MVMRVSHIKIKNWRNFQKVDTNIAPRTFIVGANASGKSNFLDVFRFLRDVSSSSGGGLQKAIRDRGGLGKIRSLAARKDNNILFEIDLTETIDDEEISWKYLLEITQESSGKRRPTVKREVVQRNGVDVIEPRPDNLDKADVERLTQTSLEQVNSNRTFRSIAEFFAGVIYLHLVPQLLKNAEAFQGTFLENDPYGQSFLERIANTAKRKRDRRLAKIQTVLRKAVPQLEELQFEQDAISGKPHLKAKYSHWRVNGAWQREDQFSDGTLRLIGLFWVLQEDPGLLLLEEPELSLNSTIVSYLAPFIQKLQGKGQVFITTHSADLLSDEGIALDEALLLEPSVEATQMKPADDLADVVALVGGGVPLGTAILPHATPTDIDTLASI